MLGQLGDLIAQQAWLGNLGEVRSLWQDYAAATASHREALDISSRLDTAYFSLRAAAGIERALEVAEASRARVLLAKLGIEPDGSALDAAAFRRLAQRLRASLLSYWVGPKRSYLWLVQPDQVLVHATPGF